MEKNNLKLNAEEKLKLNKIIKDLENKIVKLENHENKNNETKILTQFINKNKDYFNEYNIDTSQCSSLDSENGLRLNKKLIDR